MPVDVYSNFLQKFQYFEDEKLKLDDYMDNKSLNSFLHLNVEAFFDIWTTNLVRIFELFHYPYLERHNIEESICSDSSKQRSHSQSKYQTPQLSIRQEIGSLPFSNFFLSCFVQSKSI
ncbi:hypothetical protein Mgra_00006330 [Meloidogyne graminicola]|uniref:Uncharacterized protein n=1 Tax=Meloidogyne graminicola TaxID=189291 RepID=A0A8S9ZLU3_9BILA|nr:hypothetical protein Mgra_00006330 [Meloidogyne graminicola]